LKPREPLRAGSKLFGFHPGAGSPDPALFFVFFNREFTNSREWGPVKWEPQEGGLSRHGLGLGGWFIRVYPVLSAVQTAAFVLISNHDLTNFHEWGSGTWWDAAKEVWRTIVSAITVSY
jgi:hypothetical protein